MTQKIQVSVYCPAEKFIYLNNENFDSSFCRSDNLFQTINNEDNLYTNNIQHKSINLLFIFLNLISASYVISKFKLPKK